MQPAVISAPAQIDATWLTGALRASGALTDGAVASFDVDPGRGNWSSSARLRVRYAPGSHGALPLLLFLKMVNADLDDEYFGDSEVTYYTHDYVDVPDAPLVRCHHAAFSGTERRYHLLLDDVSATHCEAAAKLPTLGYGLALADGLAALHARWWGEIGLRAAGAPVHGPDHIRRFVDIAAPGVDHIVRRFGAELAPHWPDVMRRLCDDDPRRLAERARDLEGFTLIHGDVGENNVLVPRDGDGPIYIIDRQPFDWSLTTWLGVYDLAYAMVLDWDPAVRRALEPHVLRRYHEALQRRGVATYGWDRLLSDYALCAETCVFVAVEYCRGGVNEDRISSWLPMLVRALTACDDLGEARA